MKKDTAFYSVMVWLALLLMGMTHVFAAKLTLTFQDNANNEQGFRIERAKAAGPWAVIFNLPAKTDPAPSIVTYVDDGLDPLTSYSYRVKAYNAAGDSAYTATVTATTASDLPVETKPAAPSNPKLAK